MNPKEMRADRPQAPKDDAIHMDAKAPDGCGSPLVMVTSAPETMVPLAVGCSPAEVRPPQRGGRERCRMMTRAEDKNEADDPFACLEPRLCQRHHCNRKEHRTTTAAEKSTTTGEDPAVLTVTLVPLQTDFGLENSSFDGLHQQHVILVLKHRGPG